MRRSSDNSRAARWSSRPPAVAWKSASSRFRGYTRAQSATTTVGDAMTNRRLFLQQTAGFAAAASLATTALASKIRREQPRKFKLKYAPHFGMFKESAGPDPIAQLEFMA